MIVNITMKSPDAVYECIREASRENRPDGLSDAEWETVAEERRRAIQDKLSKWIEYNEYVFLEFDTEAMTAKVTEV